MLSRLILRVLEKAIGQVFLQPFQLLYGGSLLVFLRRARRLRRLAASMLHADQAPDLPVRLQIETTNLCNFKCRMCTREVIDGMNTVTMPLQQFERVVDEINPFYVTMNGLGEPLIDKTIFEKLAFLHKRGMMTAMPTNGSYIRRTKLDRLAENLPDVLTFSIDGAKKETFEFVRVLGDFDQVIANYQMLLKKRKNGETRKDSKIYVLCVLQKANIHDYRDMYILLKSMEGIDGFNLIPVFDYDPDGNAFSQLVPTADDVVRLHKELDEAIGTAVDSREADFYKNWKKVSSAWFSDPSSSHQKIYNNACLIPWFNTYIDAKGRVYPCCYLLNTSHVMGNINQESFKAIWKGETYRKFRHSIATGRAELTGCRTCPRNDDQLVQQLNRIRLAL